VNDLKVRRCAGWFGAAGFIVFLAALPLYFVGVGPGARLEDTAQFSDLVRGTNTSIIIRTSLADPLIMVGLLVFLAGFRHLIRQARQEYEWAATLVFGVGVALVAVELVGDGLQAGAALDTWIKADPTAVRGLNEGSFPVYGTIGLIMSAFLISGRVGSPSLLRSSTWRLLPRFWEEPTSPVSTPLPDMHPLSARQRC
jgi:hypothetical protein